MQCPSCSYDFPATNQHTSCPACGKAVGTYDERELGELHAKVVQWFTEWDEATEWSRELALLVLQFYHGKQWSDADKAKLDARNQPDVVFNRIFKKMNSLIGDEIASRTDPKALPRTPAHDDDVIAVTDGLRYVADAENANRLFTKLYKDLLLPGWCGHVVETEVVGEAQAQQGAGGAQGTDTRDIEIKLRRLPWDRLWWDHHSLELDYSDAAHLGGATWWYFDDAVDHYEGRDDAVDNVAQILNDTKEVAGKTGATYDDKPRWYDSKEKRVRVLECYYRRKGVWHVCHFTLAGFLVKPRPTGYLDDKGKDVCPLIAGSAFVDEEGNRYGLARHMISPQQEINKRRSKLLHRGNVNQWIVEGQAAIKDIDAFKAQMAKPDGVGVVEPGALTGGKIQKQPQGEAMQIEAQLLAESKSEIDMVGPDMPMLANASADASGRALQVRQQIGNREIAVVKDEYREIKRSSFKHIWFRVRQFWPYEKWFRVTDDAEKRGYRFVGLNRPTGISKGQRLQELVQTGMPPPRALVAAQLPPNLQQMPPEAAQREMQAPFLAGRVAQMDVDILIDEVPDTAIVQHEEMAELREVMQTAMPLAPGLAPSYVEAIIEASSLRNKEKLKALIKPKQDPQAQQMGQMMQQLQATMAQLQAQLLQAQVAKTQSEAAENQAQTAKLQAEAQTTAPKVIGEAQRDQALAMKHAAEAGQTAGMMGAGMPA